MIEVTEIEGPADRETALFIRRRVFVEEQNVPLDLEIDEHEATSRHFLALAGGEPVATARLRRTEKGIKIERVAVLSPYRRQGVGASLVRQIIGRLVDRGETEPIYVYAQANAFGFWEALGFVGEGPLFDEAGIVHRAMWLRRGVAG